ncbi:hypothetical protein HCJ76_06665 [Streptomyces sp. MC1]|uniref:hypothetical protein n=1 Tax=Streptomyces TaxID=1883 RepID=UPI0018CAD59C|nr:hypothetical protein [Streptomyces sp. MC1]MBG7697771.1 hypothetical protein [Streptomyces sp. MC1]
MARTVQLPDATALGGKPVAWDATGRPDFERPQDRLARRGARAAREAEECPAHFVAFDVLRLYGTDSTCPGRSKLRQSPDRTVGRWYGS